MKKLLIILILFNGCAPLSLTATLSYGGEAGQRQAVNISQSQDPEIVSTPTPLPTPSFSYGAITHE